MGKGNLNRTILSCLYCRSSVPSSATIGLSENQRFLRHCHGQPVDTVQKASKTNSIKIGNKIYVVKTNQAWTSHTKPIHQVKKRQNVSEEENLVFLSLQKKHNTVKKEKTELHLKQAKILKKNITNSTLPPVESPNLPKYSKCGFDLSTILKQPVYWKENGKPFLTEVTEFTSSVAEEQSFPYSTSIREVLNTTRSPVSSRNISYWRECNVRKHGSEGFIDLEEELKQNGLDFQNLIMEYLMKGDCSLAAISPIMEAYWESVAPVLENIKDAQCFQAKVRHPHLKYIGTIDCIASYRGKPALIEIKKTSAPKRNLLMAVEGAMQVVASLGAINADNSMSHQVNNIIMIYANADGSRASVHEFNQTDIQLFWKLWLRRLYHFWKNRDSTDNKFVASQTDTVCIEPNNNFGRSEEKQVSPDATVPESHTTHIMTSETKGTVFNSDEGYVENPLNTEPQTSFEKLGNSHCEVESSQESCPTQAITSRMEDIVSSSSVTYHSESVPEKNISYRAEPTSNVQLPEEEQNKTSEKKSEEQKGFFKTLWNMWK